MFIQFRVFSFILASLICFPGYSEGVALPNQEEHNINEADQKRWREEIEAAEEKPALGEAKKLGLVPAVNAGLIPEEDFAVGDVSAEVQDSAGWKVEDKIAFNLKKLPEEMRLRWEHAAGNLSNIKQDEREKLSSLLDDISRTSRENGGEFLEKRIQEVDKSFSSHFDDGVLEALDRIERGGASPDQNSSLSKARLAFDSLDKYPHKAFVSKLFAKAESTLSELKDQELSPYHRSRLEKYLDSRANDIARALGYSNHEPDPRTDSPSDIKFYQAQKAFQNWYLARRK